MCGHGLSVTRNFLAIGNSFTEPRFILTIDVGEGPDLKNL